jgi:hypothetical protein
MNRTTRIGALAALALTLGALGGLATMAVPAADAATPISPKAVTPPSGLSIAITDGVKQTSSGAMLHYLASVTNDGVKPLIGELTITIPTYAQFTGDGSAKVSKANASWSVSVKPGKTTSERISVLVGKIPKQEYRVTTLATLYPSGSSTQILVRSADPDLISGVTDPAHTVSVRSQVGAHSLSGTAVALIVAGTVLILIAATVGTYWWARKRAPQRVVARQPR